MHSILVGLLSERVLGMGCITLRWNVSVLYFSLHLYGCASDLPLDSDLSNSVGLRGARFRNNRAHAIRRQGGCDGPHAQAQPAQPDGDLGETTSGAASLHSL